MRVGIAVVVVALAGCLSKPEPPGPGQCAGTAFSGVANFLPGLEGGVTGDPTVTADLLEAFFTVGSPEAAFDIGTARRASVLDPFVILGPLPFSLAGEAELDANLTANALTMVFITDRVDGRRVYMTTRVDRGAEWGPAVKVPGLDTVTVHSLDISPDGATIYFVDVEDRLRVARRGGSGLYTVDDTSYFEDAFWPSVSADGLVLYHSTGGGIEVAMRDHPGEGFAPVEPLAIPLGDPDVTADGETLVMKDGDGVAYVSRDCTP